jgi:uncharacterized protein
VGRALIYLDANVIIRLIEGTHAVREPLEVRLRAAQTPGAFILTSRLSLLETRTLPLRHGEATLVALYDTFFAASETTVVEIDAAVIDLATRLRATHNFKSPDAIHLASAVHAGATAFLTADRALARFTSIPVEII